MTAKNKGGVLKSISTAKLEIELLRRCIERGEEALKAAVETVRWLKLKQARRINELNKLQKRSK